MNKWLFVWIQLYVWYISLIKKYYKGKSWKGGILMPVCLLCKSKMKYYTIKAVWKEKVYFKIVIRPVCHLLT